MYLWDVDDGFAGVVLLKKGELREAALPHISANRLCSSLPSFSQRRKRVVSNLGFW